MTTPFQVMSLIGPMLFLFLTLIVSWVKTNVSSGTGHSNHLGRWNNCWWETKTHGSSVLSLNLNSMSTGGKSSTIHQFWLLMNQYQHGLLSHLLFLAAWHLFDQEKSCTSWWVYLTSAEVSLLLLLVTGTALKPPHYLLQQKIQDLQDQVSLMRWSLLVLFWEYFLNGG